MAAAQNAIEKINASLGLLNGQVLGEEVPELKKRLETTVNNLDKLLTDLDSVILENRDDFNKAINQISTLLQENREGIAAIVANFRETSERLNSLADSLNSVVADNRDELNNVIESLRDAANEAESAAEKINGIVSQNSDNVTNTLENLESSSENFRDLSEELSAQPWRLLWRSKQPEKETIRR
jgi:ABC-type transporter Mla subunit MlaD